MKKMNTYLSIGLLIVLLFLTMMVFPTVFTDKSPYDIRGVESSRTAEGNYTFKTPPFEPDENFVFGSDDSGRDIYSFVIYGAKLTLSIGLSVALLRFSLGLILGIASAFKNQLASLIVAQFNSVFNAIPPLIICIIVLSIGYLKALPKSYSILVFIAIMTIVEWSRVAVLIKERAEVILEKDFIKSELIIGKSKGGIVIENLLPHMFSELVVLFFMEISRVLTLMMQLGIFGIFIGNLQIVLDTSASGIVGKATSYEPEWASMLGSSKNYIRVAPWIVLSCSLAFFTAVLGFNFLGEGLRMMYQEGRKLFKNKFQQTIALALIAAIFLIGILLTHEGIEATSNDNDSWILEEEESLIGMDSNKKLAESIASKLSELGVETVNEGFLKPYETEDYKWIVSAEAFVETEALSYRIEKTGILSFDDFKGRGQVIDFRELDLLSTDFTEKSFQEYCRGKFAVIEGDLLNDRGVIFFGERLLRDTELLGLIVPVDHISEKPLGIDQLEGPIIEINKGQVDKMIDKDLSIEIVIKEEVGEGLNIAGQILSPNATEKTKGILIGFNYNYLDKSIGEKQLSFAMALIKSIKANQDKLKKNVTFIFWDGRYDSTLSGFNSYHTEYYYPIKHSLLYIDMSHMFSTLGKQEHLLFNDQLITRVKPDSYSLSQYLTNRILANAVLDHSLKENYSVFYHKRGIPTLYIGTDSVNPNEEYLEHLRKAIVETLVKEVY